MLQAFNRRFKYKSTKDKAFKNKAFKYKSTKDKDNKTTFNVLPFILWYEWYLHARCKQT